MLTRLKYIEIENFKSYRERIRIGPLKPFNAVIGPNGSGKSNFMDAISFVMGERTRSLRVKKLKDLIHGAVIGKPVSQSAFVKAVFVLDGDDGGEISFQRTIQGSSSEYSIDSNVVSNTEYLAELEKLRINVKGKNFLVFQGAVESMATRNPKEITALFEEICGSAALKDEYDRLKRKMEETKEEVMFGYQKKKGSSAERKGAMLEKREAEQYAQLKEDLNGKLVEYALFRLYHGEREMENLENDLRHEQKEVEKIEKKKEDAEEALKAKKKEQGKLNRELAKIEQDMREVEVDIDKKRPQFIKAKERVSHMQKKLDNALKSLEQARKADEAHQTDITKLEEELAGVEKAKAKYESQTVRESQSQGKDLHLEEEQVREYQRLKKEASNRTTRYTQELDSLNREQKSDQDRLDNATRMRTAAEAKHKQKCHEKEEMVKRIEKLTEHIRSSEEALNAQKQLKSDLSSDVASSRGRVQAMQKQLEEVLEQMGDATSDQHEDARMRKKQEVIERFKRNYSGVYDRMINMCQPTHKRYNIAVTKVLGRNMDAIVVDTEHTARKCIKYLKEQMLTPETFLPLNYLVTRPLKKDLRGITQPKGVKLAYDVIQFDPQIATAVLFATGNALVCETTEDAMKVAYELGGRYDAVALDGTYYRKSGIISGGRLDLARKARRWDEKHVSELKVQKEKLVEGLRKAMKNTRKESELTNIESQITGLKTRLRHARTDMEGTMKQLNGVDDELANLSEKILKYGSEIELAEKTMQTRDRRIEEIKFQMNSVEDAIFSKFCEDIGVPNIRQYEGRELLEQEERKQKRMEFQMQIDRIVSTLEFERSRDTQTNVARWESAVSAEQEGIQSWKKREQKQKEEIEKHLHESGLLEARKRAKREEVDGMEKDVAKARRAVRDIVKELKMKSLVSLEAKIEEKRSERHAILVQCKMDDVPIPVLDGTMEDVAASDPSQSSSGESSATQRQTEREARIKIDYSTLSADAKNLEDAAEIKRAADKLNAAMKTVRDVLDQIKVPNMRARSKLELAHGKLQTLTKDFDNLRIQHKEATGAFEKTKQQRLDRFTKCFDHVAKAIERIYKSLTQNPSAQAFLCAENAEEPYLGGVDYNCVAPGKRYQPMSNLSGGEKTVAALALLFAIHSYQPAPFFVFDEVDAALDSTNVANVTKYIREKTDTLQSIVISLNEEFAAQSDLLIGVYPKAAECLLSQVATVDLTKYDF